MMDGNVASEGIGNAERNWATTGVCVGPFTVVGVGIAAQADIRHNAIVRKKRARIFIAGSDRESILDRTIAGLKVAGATSNPVSFCSRSFTAEV